MPEMINISKNELERCEDRARKLAMEKSYLQLVNNLMNRLSSVQGLEDTVENMLRIVLDSIGGVNIIVYYVMDHDIFYADVFGTKKKLSRIDDPLVCKVFETHEFVEIEHDFSDTMMMTQEFSKASTCVVPLVVGQIIAGVLKMEGLNMSVRDVCEQFQPFFSYAALILKNEISSYAKLQKAYDELSETNVTLSKEIMQHKQADEALIREREFSRCLLESLTTGVVACDAEGTLALFNSTAREWHGMDPMKLSPEEWAKHYDLYRADGVTPLPTEEIPLAMAFRGEVVKDAGMAIVAKGQSPRFILANGSVITDPAGHKLGAVVVMRDVTAFMRIEQELRQANETLEKQVAERTDELELANKQLQTELSERRRAEEALRRLNRELHAIRHCNQVMVRAEDEQTLLNDICRIICDEAGYRMAWVGLAENDDAKTVRQAAWAGSEDGYLAHANITWDDTERGRGPTGTAIRSGESVSIQDFETDPQAAPWRQSALERGYRSSAALPLKDESAETFGVLNIYSTEPNAFTGDEIRLLEELSGDLAFGITVLRGRAERKRVEKDLRESEEKFAAAFHASPSLIAITSFDGILLEVNEGYSQLLGYSRAESIGRTTANLSIWANSADRATFIDSLEKFGQITDFETTLRHKNGTLLTVIDSARTIKLLGETCVLSVVHDITERKRTEESLRVSHRFLETANRHTEMLPLLEQFVAEVRNFTGCAAVGIRMLEEEGNIPYHAYEGFSRRFYESESPLSIQSDQCMCINVIKGTTDPRLTFYTQGGSFYMNGTTRFLATVSEEEKGRTRNVCNQSGYESVALIPIRLGDRILGLIHVADDRENMVPLEVVEVLERVAMQLGTAIQRVRAEEAMKQAEEKYRSMFENAIEGIFQSTPEGRYLSINPALARMYGYDSPEDLIAHVTDIGRQLYVNPEDRTRFEKALEEHGSVKEFVTEQYSKDGSKIWASINARIVPGSDGGIRYYEGTVEDISEHRRLAEALRDSEARYRRITETLTDYIYTVNIEDGKAVETRHGEGCLSVTGYREGEFAADPHLWFRMVVEEDRTAVLDLAGRVMAGEKAPVVEHRILRKDGMQRWVRNTPVARRDAQGILLSYDGLIQDITERRLAEEEIRRLNQELEQRVIDRTLELEIARNKAQQYLDIAGVILVVIDADRRVTLINQKGCKVLGGTTDEIIGKDWFEMFVPENIRQDVIQTFNRLMAGEIEPDKYFENSVLTQSGQERLIAWRNALLRDDEGNIVGTLSSGEDITEHRHSEEQIRKLNHDLQNRAVALEAANKELETFAYSVSHDLRAPLRHIDGFLGLIQKKAETALDEKSRHYMDAISDAANKMGLLIDDLLSFSRMGRHQISNQHVDLGELTRETIREFEPETANRDIHWRVDDLPVVTGDRSMLRMVMFNLISNALKFTRPVQQAEIEISSMPDTKTETIIFVRDNGVGFDMNYVDKLFNVFQRLHRVDEFEGTGIGLANVRRIIARHGGRTWAEGQVNQGAVFYLSLPQEVQ